MPNKKSYKPTKTTPAASNKNLKQLALEEEDFEDMGDEGFEEDPTLIDNTATVDEEDYEGLESEDTNWEEDLASETLVDTRHGQGHTYNPEEAWEQGLTYTPPDDPPVLPSKKDPQGAEIAAGFAPSMVESNPDDEILPAHVDNNDDDLTEDVYVMLRNTSETSDVADEINISVLDGVVTLEGTVQSYADIALVYEIVSNMDGVVEVENLLEVAD
ncbi:MAG TPA: BON domain-containing protein [Anaerolineae bacterium]|nr:BON domain-containing protein [Anaerolineae bacterium]